MITPPAKVYTSAEAVEAAVVELNANDEDWTYKAEYDPTGTGKAIVAMYDEEGEFVGYYA